MSRYLAVVVMVLAGCAAPTTASAPLPTAQVAVVRAALLSKSLNWPRSIIVRDAFIVATYELEDSYVERLPIPLRTFSERRLVTIREALLPYDYQNYRVDINGPPPGTGLTKRYGSSRYIESGGTVEWITP